MTHDQIRKILSDYEPGTMLYQNDGFYKMAGGDLWFAKRHDTDEWVRL